MTPAMLLMPEPDESGRSREMTEDSRWWRELRECTELAPSLSVAKYWASLAVVRLSTLFLDRWKKDEAFPLEALALSWDDMAWSSSSFAGWMVRRETAVRLRLEAEAQAS